MKFAWSRRLTLIAGIVLILVTNAIALLGVAYNRSGEPESQLQLTERELPMSYGGEFASDNSGIALTLTWRVYSGKTSAASTPYYPYYVASNFGEPDWLDRSKLTELGFDVSTPLDAANAERYYEKMLPKEVLLVLEFDGPAYQAARARARRHAQSQTELMAANPGKEEFKQRADRAKQDLRGEERLGSRLFVIDAGLDATALRARYPDRGHYALVRGQIRPVLGTGAKRYLTGYVTKLSVDSINVPFAYRDVFEPFAKTNRQYQSEVDPRYETTTAFGKRLEPWIVAVGLIR
jgi:hypothetical protein